MKRIVISIYVASFILSSLLLASATLEYGYAAWEKVIAFEEVGQKILIGSITFSCVLLLISLSAFITKKQTRLMEKIILVVGLTYIVTFIASYPFVRIFVGSNLLIVFVVIAFLPLLSISSVLIYQAIKNKSK